jgi:membrane-associated phospholipid phosphatase
VGDLQRIRGPQKIDRVSATAAVPRRPWLEAALWMAVLGPYFFLVYGACNWVSAHREHVPSFYWEWERHIPFVPIFVLPYMSIDAFFAASIFLCRTRREIHTAAARILFVISASGICFLLFPFRFAFHRPHVDGWLGAVFAPLDANDMPFNLTPSLHISLRVILWAIYGRHLRGFLRSSVKAWFILIGLSTLLVWQHHFIDVVGGFAMALLALYLFPDRPEHPMAACLGGPIPRKLGTYYACASIFFAVPALFVPYGLWLLWPALSTAMVSAAYFGAGVAVFQKHHGGLSAAAEWALLPWLLTARLVQRRWKNGPAWAELPGNVLFGRRLNRREARALIAGGVVAVLDLAAESTEARVFIERTAYRQLSVLDITPPSPAALEKAIGFLHEHTARGRVYVHCELGLLRSATVAAAWLLATRQAETVEAAVDSIRSVRPGAHLHAAECAALEEFFRRLGAIEPPAQAVLV